MFLLYKYKPVCSIHNIITPYIRMLDSDKYMLSGCELIDTENISLPSQNMKFSDE
jgi:hypothetical protein